jgi:hypothetical protein
VENTNKPASTDTPIKQPRDNWRIRLIRVVKRKKEERAAKKQKETTADRAARVTANATVWIACVSIVVGLGTFWLLEKQTEATQAAVIVAVGPWMNPTEQVNIWTVGVKLRNFGHGPAHCTKTALYVERQTVPDGVLIGVRCPWNIDLGEVPSPTDPTEVSQSVVRNPESKVYIPDADLALIYDTKETIKLSGKITFDNGFSQREEPVCFKYFGVTIRNRDGSIQSGPRGYPLACDEFESQYRAVMDMKEAAFK